MPQCIICHYKRYSKARVSPCGSPPVTGLWSGTRAKPGFEPHRKGPSQALTWWLDASWYRAPFSLLKTQHPLYIHFRVRVCVGSARIHLPGTLVDVKLWLAVVAISFQHAHPACQLSGVSCLLPQCLYGSNSCCQAFGTYSFTH